MVTTTVVGDRDLQLLDSQELADQRRHRRRAAELASQHPAQCAHLFLARAVIDDHAKLQFPSGMKRGVWATSTKVRPDTSVPSMSPRST